MSLTLFCKAYIQNLASAMFAIFKKKKLSEDKAANVFVNSLLNLVESGFPDVAALINEDPEFVKRPCIDSTDSDRFLLIVLAGNLKFIPKYFDNYQDVRLIDKIMRKSAHALGVDQEMLKQSVASYQSFFSRINHPSKNTHYAMSKALFFKYDLNQFQGDYFRNMKAPNPIFLKRLDDILLHFIYDWEALTEKFRITD